MSHPNRYRYSYKTLPYCDACGLPLISMSTWSKQNNYSRKQTMRLLKIGYLLGSRYKKTMYVAVNPNFVGEM